jgi:hypothetical protein
MGYRGTMVYHHVLSALQTSDSDLNCYGLAYET